MSAYNRVQFNVTPHAHAQLVAYAQERKITPSAAAKALVESALARLDLVVPVNENAHGELLKAVEKMVLARKERHDWDEHVTLDVFRQIRRELPELHAAAIAGGNKRRVHRSIGSSVRSILAAETRRDHKGNVLEMQLPRNAGELIQSYTLLFHPEEA